MVSTCIRVVELRQFAVLFSHISQVCLSVQLKQAVLSLQMKWDRHLVLPVKRHLASQEEPGEQGPRINVALEELRERSLIRFHK